MYGLRPEIAAVVCVLEPDSLQTTFRLASSKEEELASWRSTIGRYQKPVGGCSGGGPSSGSGGALTGANTGAITGSTSAVVRFGPRAPPKGFTKLSRAEIEQKRREGKCFNCDERFTVGHKCGRLDLMFLAGRWEDEAEEEAAENTKLGQD
ncbi:unnamed protein product [Linum trigynum]|uniref:PH domain-containing protein n=1 Tax=Linum trigynum TaxID=586398 RepID=A0AAV2DVK1_9ROSI